MWESRFLRDLGSAMASLLDGLVSIVAQEALKYTVLSGRRTIMQKAPRPCPHAQDIFPILFT